MDEVEWEIVRADIAMEKARLEANGDWAKWRESQAPTNLRRRREIIESARGFPGRRIIRMRGG